MNVKIKYLVPVPLANWYSNISLQVGRQAALIPLELIRSIGFSKVRTAMLL